MISYSTFLIIIHWGGESWVLHTDRQFIQDMAKKMFHQTPAEFSWYGNKNPPFCLLALL